MMKRHLFPWLWSLLALCLTLIVVFPLVYAFFGSFKQASEFSRLPPTLLPDRLDNLDNYLQVLVQAPFGRYYFNSLLTTLLVCFAKLFLASLAAYAFAFFTFRGQRFLFLFLLGTMMLPVDTVLVANYQTVSRLGLTDHYLGICIVAFVGASQMFMLRQTFIQSPKELRDAAMMDGCGDLRFLLRILIPFCRPVMITLFMQVFVAQWNAYLWPLLVTNSPSMRTVQVGITMLTSAESTNYQVVLAGTVLAVLLPVAVFILVRRYLDGAMGESADPA